MSFSTKALGSSHKNKTNTDKSLVLQWPDPDNNLSRSGTGPPSKGIGMGERPPTLGRMWGSCLVLQMHLPQGDPLSFYLLWTINLLLLLVMLVTFITCLKEAVFYLRFLKHIFPTWLSSWRKDSRSEDRETHPHMVIFKYDGLSTVTVGELSVWTAWFSLPQINKNDLISLQSIQLSIHCQECVTHYWAVGSVVGTEDEMEQSICIFTFLV